MTWSVIRRDEKTFWHEFNQIHPLILGALLDAVSYGLRHFDETHLTEMPRMADFARWVSACEEGLGWERGTFLNAYQDHEAEKVELALSASTLAEPIRRLAAKGWEGTPSKLLHTLKSKWYRIRLPHDARSLSNDLKQLGRRLSRLKSDLPPAKVPAPW